MRPIVAAILSAVVAAGAVAGGLSTRPHRATLASRLSDRALAGERVIFSYHGRTPPASLLQAVRRGEAAGVVFFGENIASVRQIRSVAAELQAAAARSPVKLPLLLMVDQEGGAVRRLPGAPVPSEAAIGASSNPLGAARAAGRGAARTLRGAGMNVNLAPVLDVARRSDGFDGRFGRSYGSSPAVARALGAAFIGAQQSAGVAATAKHFPGLGTATAVQDTDARPVTLGVPLSVLRADDEVPFAGAIAARTKLVMVSWARYTHLDPRRPAGLSWRVVTGELRRRLHFAGVTVTDAIGAGALAGFGGTANRSVLAAGAGMDLVLCADKSVSEGASAVGALTNALERHRLGRAAFLAAAQRVIALRRSLSRSSNIR